ncbi:YobA family protein [Lysinibacillus sp. BPa_S21]|uniref:YobA family protein n=1 Tax=Lysinibacillus sp. BPa_S21 TaxID=2932478 RepID=UPI002011F37F|nr:YobA family protein [Lysinibacillus sp. BPa_S21]MCL1696969.1 YobA family protein [Lysinibacillus sp. BPa_S21]
MSKVDVRVLNNLTESKKRVMSNVVQHLEQREMKKRSWRWQYSVMSIILTVCIGLFLYTQFSGGQEQSASIPTVLDEKFLNIYLESDPRVKDQKRSNDVKKQNFESYLQTESLYAYARSKGIVPTQEQIGEQLESLVEVSINQNEALAEQLQLLNLTKEEFIEQYIKPLSYKVAIINSLMEQEKNQYKDVNRPILYFLVAKDAMNYLEKHYSQEIVALREKFDIPVGEKELHSKNGLIVAIKEHEFLVVSYADESDIGKLSMDDIVQKHGNGTWFPLIDAPTTLSLGDTVEVKYSTDLGMEKSDSKITFADIDSMKILEDHK